MLSGFSEATLATDSQSPLFGVLIVVVQQLRWNNAIVTPSTLALRSESEAIAAKQQHLVNVVG